MSVESTTAPSPAPFSPFTSYSVTSNATSEDVPTLGAFTNILRAWSHLQPQQRVIHRSDSSGTSSPWSAHTNQLPTTIEPPSTAGSSDYPVRHRTSVWNHELIVDYLTNRTPAVSPTSDNASSALSPALHSANSSSAPWQSASERNTFTFDEGSTEGDRTVEITSENEPGYDLADHEDQKITCILDDLDQASSAGDTPSLGYLDEALKFLAAERDRVKALRGSDTKKNAKRATPRRNRRQKRIDSKSPGDDYNVFLSPATSTDIALVPSDMSRSSSFQPHSSSAPHSDAGEVSDDKSDQEEATYDVGYRASRSAKVSKSNPPTPRFSQVANRKRKVKRQGLPLSKSVPSSVENFDTTSIGTNSLGDKTMSTGKNTMGVPELKIIIAVPPTTINKSTRRAGGPTRGGGSVFPWPSFATKPPPPELYLPTNQRLQLTKVSNDNASLSSVSTSPSRRQIKLTNLAKKLEKLFPGDKADLIRVVQRLAQVGQTSGSVSSASRMSGGRKNPGDVTSDGDADIETEYDDVVVDLDSRRSSRNTEGTLQEGERLVHVFIDHSNIFIGLLSYLRRHARTHPNSTIQSRSNSLPRTVASLPISTSVSMAPSSTRVGTKSGYLTESDVGALPIDIVSSSPCSERDPKGLPSKAAGKTGTQTPVKKKLGGWKMWHAALALILERGRPVSRRVLVTSSPLSQPLDGMERLGYQVRVYLRVPDLGDGMDRQRHSRPGVHLSSVSSSSSNHAINNNNISNTNSIKAMRRKKGGARHSRNNSASELGSEIGVDNNRYPDNSGDQAGVKRRNNGGNGGNGEKRNLMNAVAPARGMHYISSSYLGVSGAASGSNNENILVAGIPEKNVSFATLLTSQTQQSAPPQRIRYREQGVDELLQLKLHQAIAATDIVPPGSTIVLATGDGNVGQFNEDGFLGPVRTALKKGWRVELYAWETGLSRAWRREFGEGCEWSKNGMFRIIGLEQFAKALVDEPDARQAKTKP